jgi:hypothetical protein
MRWHLRSWERLKSVVRTPRLSITIVRFWSFGFILKALVCTFRIASNRFRAYSGKLSIL